MQGAWLLAQVKGGRERYAADNVRKQGHEPYLPQYWCERTKQRRALFPAYLFIRSVDATWHWIESTYGCRKVVAVGEQAYQVPLGLIKGLKAQENKNGVIELPKATPRTQYKRDDAVRVREETHPFWGHVGIFQHYTAAKRISILLSVLGKWVPAEIDEAMTEPV
jgi:transcription antitermination factor NusG